MVIISSSVPNCDFKTNDVTEALAIALLTNHSLARQRREHEHVPEATSHGPKLEWPKVNTGVSAEEWNAFRLCWEVFRSGSAIDTASAAAHLFQCASNELSDSLLKANPQIVESNLTDLLAEMRSLAVITVNRGNPQ